MAKPKSKLQKAREIASKVKTPKRKKSSVERYTKQGQNHPQSKSWTEPNDEGVSAKPIGWRFTTEGAKRLKISNPKTKPSREQIEKYRGKTFTKGGEEHRYIYQESRVDKSDKSAKAKFKSGGQTAPQSQSYKRSADKKVEAKPVGYRYKGNNYNVPSDAVIKREMKKPREDRRIYFETRKDKSDYDFYKKLKKGGTTFSGRQYDPYNKAMDGEKTAKPVGYRFTDKLANRLGKSVYARPTNAEVEKYLDRGVYWEGRQDKSDLKPTTSKTYASFKSGGATFSGRQYNPYNKAMDGEKTAKPVGYRFTNRLAKRLGKSTFSKPTKAEVEKYLGRGVYWEGRQDKSDLKPTTSKTYASFEYGGENEYARGGVQRISNQEAREYTENMIPFKANNLEGKLLDNGDYVVLSYGYYPIWWYCKSEGKWYGNSTKYSVTTSKQMSQSRPTYDATMLNKDDLDRAMMKQNTKFEMGGALNLLADTSGAGLQNVGGTSFSNVDLTSHLDMNANPNF